MERQGMIGYPFFSSGFGGGFVKEVIHETNIEY